MSSTSKIVKDIQSLQQDALIEMFVIDARNINNLGGGNENLFRLHPGTNKFGENIVWQGNEYAAMPVEATGFDLSTKGVMPRPKFRLANPDGLFSAVVALSKDLIGAKVIRKRTFLKYLDAVNFPDGTNASADPNQFYPDDVYYVEQKLSENRYVIEWELVSAYDIADVMLPKRQIIKDSCPWKYRGVDCGYLATAKFTTLDEPTSDPALDVCSKRLSSCKIRFGANAILPYGGFPGAKRYG